MQYTNATSGIKILKLHNEQVIGRQNIQVQLVIKHNKTHILHPAKGQIINIFVMQHKHSKIIHSGSAIHKDTMQKIRGHIQINSMNADGRNGVNRQVNGKIVDHAQAKIIQIIGIVNRHGQYILHSRKIGIKQIVMHGKQHKIGHIDIPSKQNVIQ